MSRQVSVADAGAAIQQAVRESFARADLILVTGGLGPTSDDITRELIAELIGKPLREDPAIAAALKNYFASRNRPMPARNLVQAQVPEGAIVLLRTGWGSRWPDAARYLGTAARGADAVADLHFPGLGEEGARWLVARGVRAVGIDTASIDRGQSTDFRAHRVLAAADVPIFENVASLDRVVVRGAWVVALPMKITRGTGGPLRIVAIQPSFPAPAGD